jgi:DNA-binding response OmpR family regulator
LWLDTPGRRSAWRRCGAARARSWTGHGPGDGRSRARRAPARPSAISSRSANNISNGDLTVDLTRRLVTARGEDVKLSNKEEWNILKLLVMNAGKVLTHRAIMEQVWGPTVDVQYLRIYMRQLRQKIEEQPDRPRHILTETGVGYRLSV